LGQSTGYSGADGGEYNNVVKLYDMLPAYRINLHKEYHNERT